MTENSLRIREDLSLGSGYYSPQVQADIRLNNNESPYLPPEGWMESFLDKVRTLELNRYPERRYQLLRDSIAQFHKVSPENIFCANGSNEVLQCLLLAYGGPGRKALVFEPTYLLHSHIAKITGTSTLSLDRDEEYLIDHKKAVENISTLQPDIIFICSPNNPTGLCEPCETVRKLYEHGKGLVILDEAYGEFATWNGLGEFDINKIDRRLAIIRTFSKTWSLAGVRLGYLIANPEIVRACELVALPYRISSLTALAGQLALEYRSELDIRVSNIVKGREWLYEEMAPMPLQVLKSESNFVTFRPERVDSSLVFDRLLENSVLVRKCTSWPRLSGFLRVTVGTTSENEGFVQSLSKALEEK